jgi:hypothetical protein
LIFDNLLWVWRAETHQGTSVSQRSHQYRWLKPQVRQSSCPLGVLFKDICRAFIWLKCLGVFLHLKPTSGCQTSTLIFDLFVLEGVSINIPWNINLGRQSFYPLGVSINGIGGTFDWQKYLGGFLHVKPTAGCQISTLIFDFFCFGGGLYKYSMKNILRTANFLPSWCLDQRYCPGL